MVVWLFVALILTQTYTANLASMLTAEQLEPTIDDVDQLRNRNIKVGYSSGSFVKHYVQEVLQFHPENMRNYGELEEFAEALRRKEIGSAFLEVPTAKIFVSKYCNEFIQARPSYKIGGFGFVCDATIFSCLLFMQTIYFLIDSSKIYYLLAKHFSLKDFTHDFIVPDDKV